MAFTSLHALAPAYLSSEFIARADVHTRHRNKLDVPLFRTATGQRYTEPLSFEMNYLKLLKVDFHSRVIFTCVRA